MNQDNDALYIGLYDRSNIGLYYPLASTGSPDMTRSQTDTCPANPKSLIYTRSMLDQHLRRQPNTDPTCAYGNVLRFPGSYRLRLEHEALNQCWPN